MSYVISFDLKVFEPNTKFQFEDCNINFSLIDMVMDEQAERMDYLETQKGS